MDRQRGLHSFIDRWGKRRPCTCHLNSKENTCTLFFLRTCLFSFMLVGCLLNSCPFIINILSLDDPFWRHIEVWQIQALEQLNRTRIYLVLRSGGKWLSLELKLSKCHRGEDIVIDSTKTELSEHWKITVDISPTLILAGGRTCLHLKARFFQNTQVEQCQSHSRESERWKQNSRQQNSPASDRCYLYIALGD